MMASKICLALLLSPMLAFSMEVAMASSLTFDEQAAKNRPVSKVITLLKDMLKELEKEVSIFVCFYTFGTPQPSFQDRLLLELPCLTPWGS